MASNVANGETVTTVNSERIAALRKSRAGHLGEMTKIYKQLDSWLLDYKFVAEVQNTERRLNKQWEHYLRLSYELLPLIPRETEDEEREHIAEHSKNYSHYISTMKEFLDEGEDFDRSNLASGFVCTEVDTVATDSARAGIDFEKELLIPRSSVPVASPRADDVRSIISTRSKQSSISRLSTRSRAHEEARLEKVLAEKKLAQLKRAKERRLKEQQLKLDNEILEAEDMAELASTKDQFYQQISNEDEYDELQRMTQFELPVATPAIGKQFINLPEPAASTAIPVRNQVKVEKEQLNQSELFSPDFGLTTQRHQPLYSPVQTGSTDNVLEKIVNSVDSIITKTSLPALDVVKFCGDPCEFFQFKARFHEMVERQNLTETQKMSRLLQFLDGKARKAVVGYEGVPGGLTKAMKVLEQRFGQSHIVAKACIDGLIEGANISSSDRQGLREFADKSRTLYETLSSMNALSEMNLSNLGKITGRLPIGHQVKWRDEVQRVREKGQLPTFKGLVEFMERRADAVNDPIFGLVGEVSKSKKLVNKGRQSNTTPKLIDKVTSLATLIEEKITGKLNVDSKHSNTSLTENTLQSVKCSCCGLVHKLEDCNDFKSKSVRQRGAFVRNKGLCFNCLKKGHFVAQCKVKMCCINCKQRHHSLLHKEVANDDNKESDETPASTGAAGVNSVNISESASVSMTKSIIRPKIALQVVPVKVSNNKGSVITTYALIDSGSEESFVAKSLSDKLKLKVKGYDNLSVCTLSGETTVRVGRVDIVVEPTENPEGRNVAVHDAKVVEKLNINLTRPKDLSKWPHLKGIKIPEVDEEDVTILIGANIPECQVHEESRVGRTGEPYAVRTILGWAILGPVGTGHLKRSRTTNVNFCRYGDDMLDQQMKQFLGHDSIRRIDSARKEMSIEDQRALKKMEDTVCMKHGHYEVGMLWKNDNPWLPDNKTMAEARLRSLKSKLQKNEELHGKYREFMDNLLKKGFARKLTDEEATKRSRKTWYLPHHAVFHPRKPGKVRVVFDAAAIYQGVSLNSQLLQGPDLTNNLLGVLLRFREEFIAVAADVEAMFLQVKVPPEDADALRFLWWQDDDLSKSPVQYQMVSHIFGATDSPSCSNYSLKKTAEDNKNDFSEEAVTTVKRDFYVDDLLKSLKTEENAIVQTREVTELLKRGGFHLTKWMSNSREVLATVPEIERAKPSLDLDLDKLPVERALGVHWDVERDVFQFKVFKPDKPFTKRGILSTISSLYDPIGFVCPVVLDAKKIMQRLWKLQLEWDDPIPEELRHHWEKWKDELLELSQVEIPRCHLQTHEEVKEVTLHNFCDASEDGYGMCSYLRFVHADGSITCSFLVGKSKTAPVRPVSIPRLELQAAALSAKVYQTIASELSYNIDRVMFWTDSKTVLQYIQNETKRFHAYVANRVAEIRDITNPAQWRHCPGKLNPADDASRGLKPAKFSTQHRWWKGPDFLWQSEESWPNSQVGGVPYDDPEVRAEVQVHKISTATSNEAGNLLTSVTASEARPCSTSLLKMFESNSSWLILQRRVAWLIRFCTWIQNKATCIKGALTLEELESTTQLIARMVQKEVFAQDIRDLKAGKEVKASSRIARLKPILVDGVMRVGGRLDEALVLSFEEKHPIILPNHHISRLIVRHCHERLAHSGREQTLAESRKMFWIIGGRTLIKKMIRNCFKCRRLNARPMEQVMGSLPKTRLEPYNPPFTFSGVDFFGPLFIKWGRGTSKRWGCLFTCLTTRAVYLEVAPSLETGDFIMVLRQFISRRGPPEEIRSDRGTNFVGANREMQEAIEDWNHSQIAQELQQKGIKWTFHPPAAPHMSGVWERLVQTTKRHLKTLIGNNLLSEFSLRTLFAEVESIMNNRPIVPVSDDPRDLEALTPNHFLLQRKVIGLPPGIFVKQDCFGRKQWRKVQYLTDVFYKRWINEYLRELQERQKWTRERRNVRSGDLVLVADNNLSRNKWPLGRVTQLFTGRDGKVRSVKVTTATSELHRPITKLCQLEADPGAD